MKTKVSIVPILAIIAALLIAGCTYSQASNGAGNTTTATPPPTTPPTPPSPPAPPGPTGTITAQIKEFTVEGSEFKFTPNSISVSKGDKVSITFKNTGKFPHNLIIDELNVATKTISPGQTDTVEFTASKSGTFATYCSVGNHRAQGMEGWIEI
ncbi:TPA: cupredoxin domain-containing protein [archaeon]|uniref:Cupredoxin domain-containing protein n=1 Tax=Candidatus Naiadarchaeum limnaeum TaxID=2756139 RepID=A0A832X5X0_9ARCH|nr:cupredoxin domain-containing protein [Candidatus Naiadarchaeales archaeon SRR2090153.bin1042]HIK00245.1 cupredoxin domain-containing protein [Candidatus Naiadarchaeum limnaeum]